MKDYYCNVCFASGSCDYGTLCDKKGCKGKCKILCPSATDKELDDAKSAIWRDYRNDVVGLALDLAARAKAREITSSEDLNEAITEAVDGTQRVIYAYQAKLGLLASDNEDAWEDSGLENATVEQKMFCAMERDVTEELQHWGIYDIVDEEPEEAEESTSEVQS